MTRDECKAELGRLGQGWQVDITGPQVDAVLGRVGHLTSALWRSAVDALLVNFLQAPRAGFLDHVLKAVDQAQEECRRQRVAQGNRQAKATLAGRVVPIGLSEEEQAYNRFRLSLLRRSIDAWPDRHRWTQLSDGMEVRLMSRETARIHADGLAAWLQDDTHVQWAATCTQGDCGVHVGSHTVLACLVDEQRIWAEVAAGKTVEEAKTQVLPLDTGAGMSIGR